ncbi:retrovirus-related pol polyprotein from transposon TNT 1-94 [Tanacetum coccineum]
MLEKDSEASKNKKERYKSLALKAKKESSDEETSSTGCEDEEYAMVVRGFRSSLKEEEDLCDNHITTRKPSRKLRKTKRESDSDEEVDLKKDEICLMTRESNEVKVEPDEWIKDSGYTRHMTGNKSLFSTYEAYDRVNVVFGRNEKSKIINKGTITHKSLTINDVSHVDNINFNLLSMSQICDKKCKVVFGETGSEILKDGITIGRGIRKNGLYVMKIGNTPKDKLCLTLIDDTLMLWHRGLGHANMRLIQSLSSKELVRNLKTIFVMLAT